MSFGQAARGAASFFPEDRKAGIARRSKAHVEQLSKEPKPSSRADFERSLGVFKCTADVDAGNGRRLRRAKQAIDDKLLGAPSGVVGAEADPTGLPNRRLRRATKLNCTIESEEVSGRRAFFDQFTRAEEYAELIGRPGLHSPRPKEQSLLVEGMDSKYFALQGDIEDLSTSASEECPERPRKEADSVPSLRVRRMLQSLQPAKGRLDIPLEMVARLEHLVELADRVETKRRFRSRVLREFSTTPDLDESTPTEASLPEVVEEKAEEEEEERPNVQLLVQKYESPWPTLLRRSQEGGKNTAMPAAQGSDDKVPLEKSVNSSDETGTSSPPFTDQELTDKSNALRRKGFNLLPQTSGRSWDMVQQVTLL